MSKQSFGAHGYHDGFVITPDDDDAIIDDPGNTKGYQYCLLHNTYTAAVTVAVVTVMDTALSVVIPSGGIFPVAVKHVKATGTDSEALTTLVGIVSIV